MTIEASKLQGLEEVAFAAEQLPGCNLALTQAVVALVDEVRRLTHELNDPRYMYAGGRVPRQGISCRNAEISALRDQVKKLEGK